MANGKVIEVPQESEVNALMAADAEEITQFTTAVGNLAIETQDQLKFAVGAIALTKEKHKEISEKEATIVEPIKQALAATEELFKPLKDALADAERIMKSKVVDFHESCADKRDGLLKAVETADSDAERRAIMQRVEFYEVEKVPGLAMRQNVKVEIEDVQAAVKFCIDNDLHELLGINEKVVKALCKDRKLEIPGVRVTKSHTAAITVSKVEK